MRAVSFKLLTAKKLLRHIGSDRRVEAGLINVPTQKETTKTWLPLRLSRRTSGYIMLASALIAKQALQEAQKDYLDQL